MKLNDNLNAILTQRFGKDSLIALATVENGLPRVRTVDGLYLDGAFYVVTHRLSGKMQQIQKNPAIAICGEWFTAQGVGEDLGHVLQEENREIMAAVRSAFAAWYGNGHVNEADPNTCLLKLRLTRGVLFTDGVGYEIDFT